MKRARESEEGEEGEVAGGGPPALKAQVTETNGEISCTIEETNRLRALLGLRPLNVGAPSKERQAVENFRAKREEEDKAREAREIAERLEKAREKRLLQSKLSGPGLGEVDGEGEGELLSAADWVKRSRKVEISDKEKSLALAKKLEQEEREMLQHKQQQQRQQSSSYTSADLQGLSIMHSAEELAQGPGQEIILTLADTSVLDKDERGRAKGLLDGDDVLENVNLADASRKAERDKIIKKAKQPAYSGYDDAEFEPGAVAGIRPSILPQYDKAKKQGPKLVLGEGGAVGQADHNASSDEIPMDVTTVLPQSLRVDLKDADDYYSKAEYSTFHKPKKVKGEKKQKRLRKKEESSAADGDVIDMAVTGGTSIEGGSGSGSASLESLLRQSGAVSSEGQDRRLRDQSTGGGKDDEERRRRAAYETAVNRAEDKTQSALGLSRSSLAVSAVNNEPEDDDADIAQSLARARRLALQQQRQAQTEDQPHGGQGGDSASLSVLDSGAQWSKQRVAQLNSAAAAAAAAAANESKFDESAASTILSVDGRKADGTLVFSDTTEFTARMQAQLSEAARSRAEAVVKASERQMHQQRSEAGAASAAATSATGAEDDSDNDDEQHGMDVESSAAASAPGSTILSSEPVAAIGLAATLALLKNTGELQAEEKLVGRAKDTRAADPSAKDFNVKIEYRDETGRKLTQKEAFRQINYQFHGIAPSKKKQEKRQKQLQLEDRAGSSKVVTGQGGTMRSLVQAQQATGSAFITIGGGAGAGAGGKLELGAIGGSSGGPTLTAAEIAAQLYAKQKAHEEKKAEAAEAALQQQTKVNVKSESRKQAR